ncbi:MAG TPA: hypothetical protein VN708_13740 [Terriglobales bacterium]|nr:hypothetical protein [Terriglobales bacterium]
MDFQAAQREIDSIVKILKEAEESSGLAHDDPSVIALEQIMLARVSKLGAAKLKGAQAPDNNPVEPTGEQAESPEP